MCAVDDLPESENESDFLSAMESATTSVHRGYSPVRAATQRIPGSLLERPSHDDEEALGVQAVEVARLRAQVAARLRGTGSSVPPVALSAKAWIAPLCPSII